MSDLCLQVVASGAHRASHFFYDAGLMPIAANPTSASSTLQYRDDEAFSREMDAADPLRDFKDEFHIPTAPNGEPVIYFCGNSLGLQPKGVRPAIEQELDDWARLAVDAHFKGKNPWYPYHEMLRESGARLVGAIWGLGAEAGGGGGTGGVGEVVMMNSLTVNLQLMMTTFFQPAGERTKILIEEPAFPSDIYAVKTHLTCRGLDPSKDLIIARPREGEHGLRMDDLEELIQREGRRIALVMLGGVNFFTGQVMDMARITRAAHAQGCIAGFDLAHAAGNVELRLHDWNVDFAAWCSYKYLNSGPGAVAGCFVHERHGRNASLPRLAGWWGNDPDTRFKMHLIPEFIPRPGADGWQLSNPPIFAMAPLKASLELFDRATMPALREKSKKLTGYLRWLLERQPSSWWQIITPREPESQGCQLSIIVHDHPRERFKALENEGVVCDFREPNVIRVAPVPLYNTFHDVWRFAQILSRQAG